MTDNDPFGTSAIRTRVLDSWAAAPVRFREDANLEEDLVLGGYRDRVLVELAQNAADAAARAGRPGRLALTLRGGTLVAANTGAPLDAAGVSGLVTLRASAKRDEEGAETGPVGRFGVGFAAVLAVCDAPSILSRGGGVRFSAVEAHGLVEQAAERSPELGVELRRRDGRVPVLRLPFPASAAEVGDVPQGYDTAAVLPLRDQTSEILVRRLLTELDDALLLALPALAEVVLDVDGQVRTLTAVRDEAGETCTITEGGRTTGWRLAGAHGPLNLALLADRPVEERARPRWSVTWAVPCGAAGEPQRPDTAAVIHAPTPTDEPLGLPALLIASFPLDPTRRHVAAGPLADYVLDQAADAYAGLVEHWPVRTPALLRLVPGPIGEGAVDAELRRRIVARLLETEFLPAAGSGAPVAADVSGDDELASGTPTSDSESEAAGTTLLRPRDAAVLVPTDEALTAALDGVLPGLLPAGFERDHAALTTLGVRRLGIADLVEALSGLDRTPAWWGALYAALDAVAGQDPAAREALSGLPVPLVDGRTVRGTRGTLRPVSGLDLDALNRLTPLRLRIVHPDALAGPGADRLLERLGAQPAEPRAILADPAVADAVDAVYDAPALDDDGAGPAELAEAVLTLVEAAHPRPGERFGLGGLLLPDADGGFTAATDLLLAASALADVIEPDQYGRVDEDWARRWGSDVLHAVGVTDSFALIEDTEILLDPDTIDEALLDLDGFEDWVEHVADLFFTDDEDDAGAPDVPPVLAELTAIADLDLVRAERWPQALRLLAQPPLRDAVTKPARLLLADGRTVEVPSYTSWWLSTHPVLDGRCPGDLVDDEESSLAGLYELLHVGSQSLETKALATHDPEFLAALGVRSTARALLAAPGGPTELLDRLADPARPVSRSQLTDLYCTLAEVTESGLAFPPPDRLRATLDGRLVVADAEDVVVVDAPDLLPVLAGRPYLPIPLRHALALADLLDLDLASEAVGGDADVVGDGEELPVPEAVRILLPDVADTYIEHDPLLLADGTEAAWRVVDGVVHTSTFDGLARGLAWAAGRWDQRHLVAALLAEPERTADLLVEVDFE